MKKSLSIKRIITVILINVGCLMPSIIFCQSHVSVCSDKEYEYNGNTLGCTFQRWFITGEYTFVSGSLFTPIIKIIWKSNGSISPHYGLSNCTPWSQNVTFYETPILTITSSATEVYLGEEVTLTASGATTYTWSGAGLQPPSSFFVSSVKATPPLGTTTYTVNGSNSSGSPTCVASKSVQVTAIRPPVNAGPDMFRCKGDPPIALTSLLPSLAEGSWSGPPNTIVNGVIDVPSLVAGTYTFTYTRSSDGATDSFDLIVQESVAGVIDVSSSITCASVTGTLTLRAGSYQGSSAYWRKSYDNGNSWSNPFSHGQTSISFNEVRSTIFSVAVQHGSCPVAETTVTVSPSQLIGGVVAESSLSRTCNNATGVLQLQSATPNAVYEWQELKPNVSGSQWMIISNTNGTSYPFSVTENTWFRVKVSADNGCDPVYSEVYKLYVSSVGGIASVTTPNECSIATGNLRLEEHVGSILQWERSTNGVSWEVLPNSADVNPMPYQTSVSQEYRAKVQLENCSIEYSNIVSVTVTTPTVEGVVRFEREAKDAEMINNVLTFYPVFKLYNYQGSILNWYKYEDAANAVVISATTESINTVVTKTTGFRANVKNGFCDPRLSGQATFVVNKLYVGEIRVLSKLILTEYDAHSYRVANTEGVSIQDGFSFHANSAQEFFILLDDNFSLPPADQNYILEEVALQEGLKSQDDFYFANAYQRQSTYSYIDGLGRPVQQVQRRANPEEKDIVVPIVYDAFGRIEKEFLPYVAESKDGQYKPNALEAQAEFYRSTFEKITERRALSSHPFAVKVFEASPLNRVLVQGAPGIEWQPDIGHTVKFNYTVSSVNDEVKFWSIEAVTGFPVSNNFYGAGELTVNVSIDEHGSSVKEYKDKLGQIVLKRVQNNDEWLETYFIFDDNNLLRYVIQPEGMAQLQGNPDEDFLNKWAFQYRYDGRKRPIEKRVPGAEWLYMVYDDINRLVLTQDGNQRTQNQWSFTKYDALNRIVMTGLYTHNESVTQSEMTALIDTDKFFESYTGNSDFYGYTKTVFPTESLTVLAVTYYDNYYFINDLFGGDFYYDKNALTGLDEEPFQRVKNLVTGTQKLVLGTDTWIKNVNWYDKRYRAIQTLSTNHLGGIDRVSQRYDFNGTILASSVQHKKKENDDAVTIAEEFNYDHSKRLLSQYNKVNNAPKVLMKQQHYNATGQLVEKNLHAKDDGSYHQSVDYRYNIRGWLTHINNTALSHDGGITNDDGNDYFGFELRYNNPTGLGGEGQFNGNISEAIWKTVGNNKQSYAYQYDALNRLVTAHYFDRANPLNNGKFDEVISLYDRNGNIKRLQRGLNGAMDNLLYEYTGNQLMRVTDSGNTTEGFKDGTNTGDDYLYDNNGSMKKDENKDIESITYNYLNLPQQVLKTTGEMVQYVYDATGVKLAQLVTENGETKTTDYCGSFVYEDGVLQFVLHDEGRITMTKSEPQYDYFLKDHLGNVRLAFTTKEEIESVKATLDNYSEDQKFLRIDNVRQVYSNLVDHTKDATNDNGYAVRLSGGEAEQIGLAKSLQVLPGDKVHMEVFAKYIHPNDQANWEQAVQNIIAAIASAGASSAVVDGAAYNTNQNAPPFELPFHSNNSEKNDEYDGPKAYLNYVFVPLDSDLDRLKLGFKKLSQDPRERGQNVMHEKLELEFEATEAGYMYIYFSNENELVEEEVFFDDFKVTHTKSMIIQDVSYYAFGMESQSITRESAGSQAYLYNSKEKQKVTGWLDHHARQYDASIARWIAIDPKSDMYHPISPYNYVANNPLIAIDPTGEEIIVIGDDEYRKKVYSAILQLAKTKTGFEILAKTIGSKNKLVIQQDKEGRRGNQVYGRQPHGDGTMRAYLNLNFDRIGGKNEDGSEETIETLLSHEFTHFLDEKQRSQIPYDVYRDDDGNNIMTRTFSSGEIDAVEAENKVRATYGMVPLRTLYQGINIFDKEVSKSQYGQFSKGNLKSVENYWKLVDKKDKFNPSSYKGQFTDQATVNKYFSSLRVNQVVPGTYNNSQTLITKTTRATRYSAP